MVSRLVLRAVTGDCRDRGRARLFDLADGGVQQQGDVLFIPDLLEQNGIEDERVSFRVPVEILDEDLIDDSAFARPAVVVAHVRGGAQDPEAHLARGVAAKHGAVLHEHDLGARAGGGHGPANSGHAAADDCQVGRQRTRPQSP